MTPAPGAARDIPAPGPWEAATVVAVIPETPTATTFRLRLPAPPRHLPGQHYVLRLTAPDGYTATRSYSAASPAGDTDDVDLTVERLPDGEVSSFLHDEVVVGDELEVRGPIGGWFVWRGDGAALLVGGGSGVVPLMAMLRHARRHGLEDLIRLVVSVRTPADLYYAAEIPGPETTVVYTRTAAPGFDRAPGRLTAADLAPAVRPDGVAYVCGSSGFADATTGLLADLGVPAERIRVERFGPTG